MLVLFKLQKNTEGKNASYKDLSFKDKQRKNNTFIELCSER